MKRVTALLLPCAWLAVSLGCVPSVPVFADYSFSRPVPRRLQTVAVLPFCGDDALGRPAEEAAAHRLREQRVVGVMPPYPVARALDAAAAAAPGTGEWREAVRRLVKAWEAGEPASAPPPEVTESARALAAALGADALLLGSVVEWGAADLPSGPIQGALAGLLLLDGATGAPVAFVLRSARFRPAQLGLHEAAMDAALQSADVIRVVLQAAPGERPAVRRPVSTRRAYEEAER